MKRLATVILVLGLLCSCMAMAESGTSYFDDVMEKAQEKQQAPDTKLTLPLTFNAFWERFDYMCNALDVSWNKDNVDSMSMTEDGLNIGFNVDNLTIWADNTEHHNIVAVFSYVKPENGKTTNAALDRQIALVATLGYDIPESDSEIETMYTEILDDMALNAYAVSILSDTCPSWDVHISSDIADFSYELSDDIVWFKAAIKQA